jgi:hypothetical protein
MKISTQNGVFRQSRWAKEIETFLRLHGFFAPAYANERRSVPMEKNYVALGVGLGICFGAAVGAVLEKVGLGVAMGIIIGLVLGAAKKRRTERADDEP